MSNTDGEDTESESGFDYLMRKAGEQVDNVIIKDLRKELASLREQLATEQDMRSTAEFANRMIIKDLNEKLKQKEDENRELLIGLHDLFDPLMVSSEFRKLYPGTCKNLESLIHKHKKNLSA